jgi:hypothetical protein
MLQQRVEVINAGLPGGTSAEEMVAYMLRDRHLKPDIVIIHNGGNDSEPLFYSNYRPDYAYFRAAAAQPSPRPGEALILKSAIVQVLYAYWLNRANSSAIIRFRPEPAASPESALTNVRKNNPVGFERNVDSIVKMALQDGALPIIFPFVLANESVYSKLPNVARYNEPFHAAVAEGLAKNLKALQRVAKNNEVNFLELPIGLLKDEDFFDHCHMQRSGELVKANFLAETIYGLLTAKQR